MSGDQMPKSRRGGKRPGAGRKPKGFVPPSTLGDIDVTAALAAPVPDEIETIVRPHVRAVIESWATMLKHGVSEAAVIAAAKAVLDRGWGKPAVEIPGDAMLPFASAPDARISFSAEIRAAARTYGQLAVLRLERIMRTGTSESARVAAGKALEERGLGLVGPAKLPEDMRKRSLGKKEELAQAAEQAAQGRYATPAPPRLRAETLQ